MEGNEFSLALMDIGLYFMSRSPRGEKMGKFLEEIMLLFISHQSLFIMASINQAISMPFLDVDTVSLKCLVTR